jgi:hypothetical protein
MSLSLALVFGLGLGLKHAVEADHVAAVATLVARGGSVLRASALGLLWGGGHALAVVGLGLTLVLLDLRVPARFATALDLCVAVMLVVLGVLALRARRSDESGEGHGHGHVEGTGREGRRVSFGLRRALVVGFVHGASGTAALTLAAASAMPDRAHGALFVAFFGVGSAVSMAVVAALLAWPLGAMARKSARATSLVLALSGAFSIAMGLVVGWQAVAGA